MPKKPIANSQNSYTILAGDYRRKKLSFAGDSTLRPTSGRVRETLFNWLQFDIVGARTLDCFSGSGALAFEAFSRGATEVTLVEKNPQTAALLSQHIRSFNTFKEQQLTLFTGDVLHAPLKGVYDIIFLDPPFHKGLVPLTLTHLIPHIRANTLIYIESEAEYSDARFTILKKKKAGEVHYMLIRLATV